jgi:hypothetical protein
MRFKETKDFFSEKKTRLRIIEPSISTGAGQNAAVFGSFFKEGLLCFLLVFFFSLEQFPC